MPEYEIIEDSSFLTDVLKSVYPLKIYQNKI